MHSVEFFKMPIPENFPTTCLPQLNWNLKLAELENDIFNGDSGLMVGLAFEVSAKDNF